MEKITLASSLQLGSLSLPNRILMAALTRTRANPETCVPNEMHVEYYSQRAESGFMLTECSQIEPTATSFFGSCGIHSEEQVSGWKKVTDAVHAKGGRILLQIWHGGRAAHPDLHNGRQAISSFGLAIREIAHTPKGKVEHQVPKEMTIQEIKDIIQSFRKGAENALKAGFDGVELHGANGYLVDQFLRDSVNKRKDIYGGSVENRCRFALEIIDQLIEVFGAGRVGMKVSPLGRFQDISDSDPVALYSYLFSELSKRKIAFVEVMEKGEKFADSSAALHPNPEDQMKGSVAENLRKYFSGLYIANNNFDFETAQSFLDKGLADAITFGRMYISNPDLVERYKKGFPLTEPKPNLFYRGGAEGYIDYPRYS